MRLIEHVLQHLVLLLQAAHHARQAAFIRVSYFRLAGAGSPSNELACSFLRCFQRSHLELERRNLLELFRMLFDPEGIRFQLPCQVSATLLTGTVLSFVVAFSCTLPAGPSGPLFCP